jgi:hypothetical protein
MQKLGFACRKIQVDSKTSLRAFFRNGKVTMIKLKPHMTKIKVKQAQHLILTS